jgi:type I restriction enzyme, S subunit
MSNLPVKTLDDVCEFIIDCLHSTAPTQNDGYPLIRTPNIGRGRLNLNGVYRVSEETYREWTHRAIPQENDLILAREAPAGNVAIIKNGQTVCLGQRTVHLRPDPCQVDPDFLCYFLLVPKQQGALLAAETGATSTHVNMKDIRRLPLHGLPHVDLQRRAGQMLAAYDDLIENNRRRMQLLEQAARLLYEEWFVRLRFPGHEHVKIKDGIPEGWERVPLGNIAKVNRASLGKNHQGEIEYIDISAVSPGMINETTSYRFADAPSRARRIVQHGDIIWSCVRPNRRSHAIIWRPHENLIASTGFAVLTPVDLPTAFLYQAVKTNEFVGYLANNAQGVAYPAVKASDFESALIMVPKKVYLEQFNEIAEPLIEQVHTLRQQCIRLAKARDLLLPRLMNGAIAV